MTPSSLLSSVTLLLYVLLSLSLFTPLHAAPQYTQDLTVGIPFRPSFNNQQRLLKGNTALFRIALPQYAWGILQVTVSPLSAEAPGLYADFSSDATADTAQWNSAAYPMTRAAGDVPSLTVSSYEADGQSTLYATVECSVMVESACVFTIQTVADQRQRVWPGLLSMDKVQAGQTLYYDFAPLFYGAYPAGIPASYAVARDDIHITATTLRGRISVFVLASYPNGTVLPGPGSSQWQQVDYNNEVILIPSTGQASQQRIQATQTFIIGVRADDAQATEDGCVVFGLQVSYRSLVVADNGVPESVIETSCRFLSDDVPTPGQSLTVGDWDQYCFYAPTAGCPFDVSLTTLSGEQDIYLWFNGGFQLFQAGTESDNVRMIGTAPRFYALIIYTPNNTATGGLYTPGRYNVLFHSNCSYSMQEQAVPSLPQLQSAEPERSTSLADFSKQFEQFRSAHAVSAKAMKAPRRSGDVSLNPVMEEQEQAASVDTPQLPQLQVAGSAQDAAPDVRVTVSDSMRKVLSLSADYLTVDSSYHAIQLTQGQPQYAMMASSQVMRFVYQPLRLDDDLTFELRRRSGSDPNMYISTSLYGLPLPTECQWYANFSGDDYTTVDRMHPEACNFMGCYYHIAVLVDGERDTGFTLTVSEGEALTDLQSGLEYANRLKPLEPDYLRFVVQQPGQDLRITLTDTGRTQPRLYVSTTAKLPNATNSQFSLRVGDDGNDVTGQLVIRNTQNQVSQRACQPTRYQVCIYYIGVVASSDTSYSIVVQTDGPVELTKDRATESRINTNQLQVFKYIVSPGYTRFAVSLYLISGLANFYVSNSEAAPSPSNSSSYSVMRAYNQLNTPITIYENSNWACHETAATPGYCTYTIAVLGVTNSYFSLTPSEGLIATVGIRNGQPIPQVIPTNQTYYWHLKLQERGARFQVCVTVMSGDVTGYWTSRADTPYPNADNYELIWRMNVPGYGCIFNPSQEVGERFFSLSNPSTRYTASVSIMFLTQLGNNDTSSEVQLSDGVPQAMMLHGRAQQVVNEQVVTYPANPLLYFNFILSNRVPVLTFDLYAVVNDADLYLQHATSTQRIAYPTRTNYWLHSASMGSDIITVMDASAGRYLGAAFHTTANTNAAVFIITASTGRVPQQLQAGLAVVGFVSPNLYKIFSLTLYEQEAVEITLTPTNGNPDLYAGLDVNVSAATAIWQSASNGVDIISIPASDPQRPTSTPWTLYVAVHANAVSSDFNIAVSLTSTGSSYLQPGVPTPGVLQGGEYHYYQFRPNSLTGAIDFTIQRISSGSPALLISYNNPQPTLSNTTWQSASDASNLYYRLGNNPNPRGTCLQRNVTELQSCVYYIAVYAQPYTSDPASNVLSYTIMVGQPSDLVELRQGFPQSGRVLNNATTRYHFVNTNQDSTVVFAATASAGEVELFASHSPNVGPSNHSWYSARTGDDVLVIRQAGSTLYYYVAVHNSGDIPAQYSLLGKAYTPGVIGSGSIWLLPDQTQNDFCAAGDYTYYTIQIDEGWTTMTVSVSARLGDPDVYVNSPSDGGFPQREAGTYHWGQWQIGSDTIRITPEAGQEQLAPGRYFLAVYAASGSDIFYAISVSGEGRTQTLYSGETYTNELQAGHSMQYAFLISPPLAYDQLIFSLTSRTGDTDMFISDAYRVPDSTNYNWTSTEVGSAVDTVVLRTIPDPTTGRQQLHVGWYYISVVNTGGSSSAAYALTATYGTKTALVDGQPTASSIRSGGQVLFDALYPAGMKFTITLTQTPSSSGMDADPVHLYVSLSPNTIIPNRPASYQWHSSGNGSVHTLEVEGDQCMEDACRYYIAVYMPVTSRPAHSSDFTIATTTAASIVALTPGLAVDGQVTVGAYHVYKFQLSCASSVNVLLTAFNGNPDLFMNMGPTPPTSGRSSSIWWSDNAGAQNDVISISPDSPQFRNGNRSMIGTYFVAVYGAAGQVSDYTLLLTVSSQCSGEEGSNSTRPTALNDGIPQFGRVALRAWAYYTFTVAPRQWPTGVTFALSPLDGSDPDMFITKDGSLPDLQHYAWDAQASTGDDDIVYISANATNPTPCVPLESTCTYTVGVYGFTASLYTITASTNAAVLGLQLDYSKDGAVGPFNWRYYVVRVEDSSQPLVVIVSPNAGNPDLYVELERLPTMDSPTSKTFGVDVVTIPQPTPGRYFIGVYGNPGPVSLFSIVASQRGIDLRNGRAQDDALGMNERRYYYFLFNEPQPGNRPFRLQIDAISFNPQLDVYVRRDQAPSEQQYQFMLSSANGNGLHLVVMRNDSQWRQSATWRVMVVSRSENAVFAITASQGTPPIYLSDGRPTDVAEAVPAGEYRYFRTLILSNAYPVSVSVNLHYGAAQLFVSTSEPLPGLDTSFTWTNTSRGVGAINLVVPRTALPGYVYASVRSDNFTSASYTVVMSTGLVVMQAGQLQSASCQQQSLTNAFVVNLPFNASFTDDVTLSIQPANAASANYSRPMLLYVTTNSSLARPTAGNSDWNFMILDWAHPFTISRNDVKLQACVSRGNCELRIVVGCTGFTQQIDYQFSVVVGASFVPVLVGQVAMGSGLTAGQDRYYTIDLGDSGASSSFFQMRVEPCVGNVNLYVNYLRGGVPTAGNNDASSTQARSAQQVTITTPISQGKVMATVRGTTATPAQYRLSTSTGWDWDYISPSVTNNSNYIWVAAANSVPDRSIKIWFLTARAPQAVLDTAVERPSGTTGFVKYTVYYRAEPNMEAIMFTQCGLARATVATSYSSSSTAQTNATVTFRVPTDVNRYSVNVLAQYVWRRGSGTSAVDTPATEGYMVYRYLSGVLPGQGVSQPTGNQYPDDDESSSSGRWYPPHPADNTASSSGPKLSSVVLAFAIGVPLFVFVCAIIVFLHMKHQHIHNTGGVELNESFSGSSSRASDKYGHLVEEEPDTGGYVPPGAQFTRTAAGLSQQQPLASDTNGYSVQTGGGDYGGQSGGGMDGGHGGWGAGSAQSHYAAQAANPEPEHISGRGFYEL